MTTNETFFFRDKVPFDHFREMIVPETVKARASRRKHPRSGVPPAPRDRSLTHSRCA